MKQTLLSFPFRKKKNQKLFSLLFFFAFTITCWAQEIEVKGKVTDSNSKQPIPGVNIVVKGTAIGDATDFDGNFSLTVPSKQSVLVISYIGFVTQEIIVGDTNFFTIELIEDAAQLDEVVVTALGIKKETKSLGYAVQEVKGESMVKAREPNVVNSLTGKVAGLTIRNSTDLFADPSISLRGGTPLIVIDGIPSTDNDYWKLNADDIAEISVLKGATASALYGSIGRSGALMITTKRGENGVTRVDYNTSAMFQPSYIRIPKVQTTYGNGDNGSYAYVNGGGGGTEGGGWIWGPKLDQLDPSTPSGFNEVVQYNSPIDPNTGNRIPIPFISRGKDNVKNFFDTGLIYTNNIAVSGGNDKGNFRVTTSHIYQKGVAPNTGLNNSSFGVSGGYNLTDKLKVDASLTYNKQYTKNFPQTGYGPHNQLYNLVLWTGVDVDVRDLRDYWAEGQEGVQQKHFNTSWYNNPYFIAYEALQGYYKDNTYGNLNINYDPTEDFTVNFRTGFNSSTTNRDWKEPQSIIGYGSLSKGDYFLNSSTAFSLNVDLIASYSKEINEDLKFNASVGASTRYWDNRNLSLRTDGLTIPDYYNTANSINPLKGSNWYGKELVNSIYTTLDVEFLRAFYLGITGRQDWVSTLPVKNNNFFYPSVSFSAVISDLVDFGDPISFVKLRGSWANVSDGRTGATYSHLTAYNNGISWNNNSSLNYPSTLLNDDINPETSDTYEVGLDIRFFKSRLKLDATYYSIKETNNIVTVPISITSGFGSRLINGNEYARTGVEFILAGTPIKSDDFRWDIATNWSSSHRTLESVYDGSDRIGNIKVGSRTDQIYSTPYLKTPGGQLIYGSNGFPLNDTFSRRRGYSDANWVYGFQNTFTYKDFSLNVAFDGRLGGLIYSTTNQKMWWSGTHPGTVNEHREAANNGVDSFIGPGVVVVGGDVEYDIYGNITNDTRVYAPNTTKINYISWNKNTSNAVLDHYYSQSFLKLREITLTYNIPQKYTSALNIDKAAISFVGRNLALWSDLPNVDPDSGFDNLQTPSTRNIGFNLNVSF
ncbi:SusC/RagA family TonB-linked outer membrane protein [Hwangdonia lutea]|uniref:SusC/RagA family TonB-linked outer membrane protein n=1 Tax=Hwangdonia lutea TaxID=3075823 RepID=A0AA97EPQ8_9FLAO|nr:SusC/RagA family TonB-linked outer membrane protein [Hwangdonia sp. SCSIO 19198]WOD43883.1 SusC/RagA family TonB-linked outer membrane protein [Hwangdonia sp. SCSIO 19198]